MIITIEDLQKFTQIYPDDNETQQDLFIQAANDIVCNYLRYNPEEKEYNIFASGTDTKEIEINYSPITEIKEIKINNETINIDNIAFMDNFIFYKDSNTFPKGNKNINIIFKAGYKEIPAIIKLTTLRIAGILQTENNNNIGISSKSFQDSGTRTFVNTTNFDKYLLPISDYRIK
ncbi:hypothetical protein [Treponema denticola]|uniref:hypothetical protein n=1 Tax=Treponema denticola TaxID=158 RepID=UPI0020A4BA10|nr:hypothetical protein [Treponema denticola]UTC92220.1 hypothetical protein E4N84_03500 [Treponema denticola]